MAFAKIAPFLQDPLVLIGFTLFLFFSLFRTLLKSNILRPISGAGSERILHKILLFGFALSALIMIFGFGLKYRELSEVEQEKTVAVVRSELLANYETLKELGKNTTTILGATQSVSQALRHKEIAIFNSLFPWENLNTESGFKPSLEAALDLLQSANSKGILKDPLELNRAQRAAVEIRNTIQSTRSTVKSLSDKERMRYLMTNTAWQSNAGIVRRVHVIDMTNLQGLYTDFQNARNDYGILTDRCVEYLDAIESFLDSRSGPVDGMKLSKVLSSERLYISIAQSYGTSLADKLERIDGEIHETLK